MRLIAMKKIVQDVDDALRRIINAALRRRSSFIDPLVRMLREANSSSRVMSAVKVQPSRDSHFRRGITSKTIQILNSRVASREHIHDLELIPLVHPQKLIKLELRIKQNCDPLSQKKDGFLQNDWNKHTKLLWSRRPVTQKGAFSTLSPITMQNIFHVSHWVTTYITAKENQVPLNDCILEPNFSLILRKKVTRRGRQRQQKPLRGGQSLRQAGTISASI